MTPGPSRHSRHETRSRSLWISHGAATLALALILGGCAGDLNPVRDVFVATGLGEAEREGPDFIAGTRPGELAYAPIRRIGASERPLKTDEELAEMEEEMRGVQESNAARADGTRRLIMLPDPEPVIVEPLPDFDPEIDPARP